MQLEYKTSGVQPWLKGDERQRQKSMAQLERKRAGGTLETKSGEEHFSAETARVLAAADRRIAELRRALRALGIDPNE